MPLPFPTFLFSVEVAHLCVVVLTDCIISLHRTDRLNALMGHSPESTTPICCAAEKAVLIMQ